MKRIKQIGTILLAAVLIVLSIPSVSAYSRTEHDEIMCDVLFKNFKVVENDKSVSDIIEALECASYLAIDQYNGNGQSDLDYLKNYGVKGIPNKISDIDYNAGAYHRRATHRGWNGEIGLYEGDTLERWKIRKEILLNTADKIFDFNGNNEKKDSFCAIIYYIHILGDRIADKKYYQNADIMELGGRTDKQDITHELLVNFEILFADQKHTHKYQHVVTKLEKYNSDIYKLISKSPSGISDDDFIKYQKYANEIEEVLECNLPEMLKEEAFFREVFYQ